MLKSFWFYFFSLPVLLSLITFSIPINFIEDFINTPLFSDAVQYCEDVVNDDPYITEYGTMQDQCVANFMGEPKIIAPLIFLFSLLGLLFIFPFIIYVILYFIKKKVYCDN
ncbi:MAG: hypothetical protein HN595_06295 [Flavobacteriaceae bacterium]|nr:hypothetical protein [Flavobacteriaceae bacterium]